MTPERAELVQTMLRPASILWALAAGTRNLLYDRGIAPVFRLPVPVVSIGNITVGGTGKTPLVIETARRLMEEGRRPLVLSRGYRSRGSGTRIVSDGRQTLLGADEAGDEPYLIARRLRGVPVVVDPDRVRGGREGVRRFEPGIVLLDDGFQHRRLGRDLDVVVLDAVDPFGRYAVLPSGFLREPFGGLARADIFVVTHAPEGDALETMTRVVRRYNAEAPIIRAAHVAESLVPLHPGDSRAPSSEERESLRVHTSGPAVPAAPPREANHGPDEEVFLDLRALGGAAIFAFCGIGNPHGFGATLRAAGARIVALETFPDHHPYTDAEVDRIADAARTAGATFVVTTEKDAVRIRRIPENPPFLAVRIRMRLSSDEAYWERVLGLAGDRAGAGAATS